MDQRGTYALLALFFVGLSGLWLADFAKLPTRRDRERMRSRVLAGLIDVRPDDLRKVEILGGEAPMVFERREGNDWQMTAPADVAADPSMVETLAFNLKELTRRPEADTLEGDPASFGLANPDRTVRLWGKATDEPLATLEVGRLSLDRRYVRAKGSEGIEVVDAQKLDLLRLPPLRWRDRELFRVPSFEVDGVRVAKPEGELKLRRDPDSWRITAPIRSAASEVRVDGLIADLGSLRVVDDTRFVANDVRDADLDRYGLKTPPLTIEIQAGRDGRRRPPQSIRVGKPVEGKDGQLYAMKGDQDDVVAVDARIFKGLGVDPNAYRSPKVADINPARVLRVGFEGGGHNFEIARAGRDWMFTKPSVAIADRKGVEDFLKGLTELQTSIYLTPANAPEPGLDPASMTIKVWQAPDPRSSPRSGSPDPNGELALSLKVGRRDAARRSIYAQLENDRTILALPDSSSDLLTRNPLSFRDRLVLAVESDHVERLTLAAGHRKITLRAPIIKLDPLVNNPMGWWMIEPIRARAEDPSVGKLLKLLAGLRAEALVTESSGAADLKSFGLETPALTVTWSAPPPPSTAPTPLASNLEISRLEDRSLLIGAPVPDRPNHRFAKLVGGELVFTLGPEALSALDAEFHDHRALVFDVARVRRVDLAWPDRSLALIPTGPADRREWSVEGSVEVKDFDPAQVGPLVQELSNLTTSRFFQYTGAIPAATGLASPRLAIRLELAEGTPPLELRVGHPVGNGHAFATTSGPAEGLVFLLAEAPFAHWIKPPHQPGDLPFDVFAP